MKAAAWPPSILLLLLRARVLAPLLLSVAARLAATCRLQPAVRVFDARVRTFDNQVNQAIKCARLAGCSTSPGAARDRLQDWWRPRADFATASLLNGSPWSALSKMDTILWYSEIECAIEQHKRFRRLGGRSGSIAGALALVCAAACTLLQHCTPQQEKKALLKSQQACTPSSHSVILATFIIL